MELYQLKYVSHIAQYGSVAKAAEELYVSRQAVSKALRSLEQEVGFEIFDRVDKMKPTARGREIIKHADKVLHELSEIDLYTDAQKSNSRQKGALSVAFKSFPLDFLFFNANCEVVALVNEFKARTPDCSVVTYKLPDTAMLNALQEGTVDVGFVQGEYDRPGVKLVPVSVIETRAITLKGNPLCQKAPLRISDLAQVPIRSPLDLDLFTNIFVDRCRHYEFEPLFQEVPLNDGAIDDFCSKGGVHLQPYDPLMETTYTESAFIPFHPQDRIDLPLCLAYREDAENLYTAKLVNFIKNSLRR